MKKQTIIVMGVSGSGKSTVGQLLANEAGGKFYDGDDFHPPENVAKMASGTPLTDKDRQSWLESLARLITEKEGLLVIACSALKEQYRKILVGADFVFLKGDRSLIEARLKARENHYMPPSLLDSQFADLEAPQHALALDVSHSPEELVGQIRSQLSI
ncbi:gluconokinase [bacterium]|nr:gluconokinase [bacterium]